MQALINQVTVVIFLFFLLILVIMGGVALMLFRMSKKRADSDPQADLSEAQRYDADELNPIEDIRDDMIIEKGGNRFVAVISCMGNDFYTSSRDEKIHIQNNYIDFIFALEEPISFRQYDEGINVDHTLNKLRAAYKNVESRLFHISEDFKEQRKVFTTLKEANDPGAVGLSVYLENLKEQLESLQWRLEHIESQINYLERITGGETGKQKQKLTYVVSWSPEPTAFLGAANDSVHDMAIKELDRLCGVKMKQLTDAGAVAKRCTTMELVDIVRRHTCPVSSNRYPISQVYESSYFDDITSTESFDRALNVYEDEIANQFLYGGKN